MRYPDHFVHVSPRQKLLNKITLALGILNACGKQPASEIEETKRMFQFYYVKPGDTVDSISDKYEMQKQDFIHINQLEAPYKLTMGQRVHVHKKRFDNFRDISKEKKQHTSETVLNDEKHDSISEDFIDDVHEIRSETKPKVVDLSNELSRDNAALYTPTPRVQNSPYFPRGSSSMQATPVYNRGGSFLAAPLLGLAAVGGAAAALLPKIGKTVSKPFTASANMGTRTAASAVRAAGTPLSLSTPAPAQIAAPVYYPSGNVPAINLPQAAMPPVIVTPGGGDGDGMPPIIVPPPAPGPTPITYYPPSPYVPTPSPERVMPSPASNPTVQPLVYRPGKVPIEYVKHNKRDSSFLGPAALIAGTAIGLPMAGMLVGKAFKGGKHKSGHHHAVAKDEKPLNCLVSALFAWPINQKKQEFAYSKDKKSLYIKNSMKERLVRAAEVGYVESIIIPNNMNNRYDYTIIVNHCDPRCKLSGLKTIYGGLVTVDAGIKKGTKVYRHTVLGEIDKSADKDLIFQIKDCGEPIFEPRRYLAGEFIHGAG